MERLRSTLIPLLMWLGACTVESRSSYGFDDGQLLFEDWAICDSIGEATLECAKIAVPLDYDRPQGPRILIALNRLRTEGERRGVVLLNPGGPGGSGRGMLSDWVSRGLPEQLAPGFDLVGFDPRGVGESTSGRCDLLDRAVAMGESASGATEELMGQDDASEFERGEAIRFVGGQCKITWGPLFDRLGSNNVVRDMEAIRVFLGEDTLSFIGTSYGTRLGALYAQTFPERTRAMVLDAPMAPIADTVELSQGQFEQTVQLHELVFDLCEQGELSCPDNPRDVFEELLAAADELGYRQEVMDLWLFGLSYGRVLGTIPGLLNQQASVESSDWIRDMVARLDSEGRLPSVGQGAALVANISVHCADNASYSLTIEQAEELISEARASSPLFGSQMEGVGACRSWPVAADPVPQLEAPGAPPLLIIGGGFDRLTPLAWAEALDASLESSVLLRSTHWGHGAISEELDCVRAAVSSYLVDLVLPEEGTVCDAALDLRTDLSQPD